MEGYVLEIEERGDTSHTMTRRLRREGRIPTIVYHRGESSVPGSVSYKDFTKLAKMAKISQVFTFQSPDGSLNGRMALVRDIQQDHLSGKVIHVDFQALKDDEEITVTVPLHYVGDPVGVKTEGGQLSVHTHELDVKCLPKFIPLFIEVDVSALKLNDHLHAADMKLPEGVGLDCAAATPLVSVVAMKEEVVETVAAQPAGAPAEAASGASAGAAGAAADAKGQKAPAAGKK